MQNFGRLLVKLRDMIIGQKLNKENTLIEFLVPSMKENGKVVLEKVREPCDGLMELPTKDFGRTTMLLGKVSSFMQQETFMKVNGGETGQMVKVHTKVEMEGSTMVNGKTIYSTVKVEKIGLMAVGLKVFIIEDRKKDKESTGGQTDQHTPANGHRI